MRKSILCLLIIGIVCIAGCTSGNGGGKTAAPTTTIPTTTSYPVTTLPPTTNPPTEDPIAEAIPYLNAIVVFDPGLRALSAQILESCEDPSKECRVNAIYRYVVENMKYYSDPRGAEYIQTPQETLQIGGGDCEDLTILLCSLLENVGIKTYMVLTEDHAYSLVCGVDPDNMWKYIGESMIEQLAKDLSESGEYQSYYEDKELFLKTGEYVEERLGADEAIYYGGDGKTFDSPVDYMNICIDFDCTRDVEIYVIPSYDDFENFISGEEYYYYENCVWDGYRGQPCCSEIYQDGGVMIYNYNNASAIYKLTITKFYHISPDLITSDEEITYYELGGDICIVMEATGGVYSYPGLDLSDATTRIAIDPITLEYYYLD
ncbi:MAG: transglutaminase-like domain-containing protein [Candidatus Methanofastidiosia archaeon]